MNEDTILYNYSEIFHEFLYESVANKDPMVKDRILIPRLATTIKPPKVGDKEVACFDEQNQEWVVKVDHRDTVVTDEETGRTITIQEIGVLPEDIEFEPVPEKTWQQKRQDAYPPIGDQLDAIMKWLATETEFQVPAELKSIAMQCMSVKAHIPKE